MRSFPFEKYNAWIVTGVNLGMVLELVSTIETVETSRENGQKYA